MQQIVKPNLNGIGYIGMCLAYAGRAFGVTSGPATAWGAWQQARYKHANQNFPSGVSFPIWFSGANGAGHVAIFTPNGIYSSPWEQGTTHAVLTSISQVEQLYGVEYVGWSEDIEGKQVIKEDDMPTAGNVNTAVFVALRRKATQPEIDKFTKLKFGELLAYLQTVQEQHNITPQVAGKTASYTELKPGLYEVK